MPEAQVEATPAELFERAETERRFARAFAGLSAKRREAFVLVTLEGWCSGREGRREISTGG
jgi:DNA-directed RNA polymerase specialized sigma24 family protein